MSVSLKWYVRVSIMGKSGISKKDGHSYGFQYIKQDDLPDNYKKSSNIRPKRVSDEDKKKRPCEWLNKEYQCPNCNRGYRNGYKSAHNKRCGNKKYSV